MTYEPARPASVPATGSGEAGRNQNHRFRFHGTALEWFPIWLGNVFLTAVTLGIWSPWATVRKRKWFLRRTEVAGRPFDWHATGWQVFKGRLLALVALVLFGVAFQFPVLGAFAFLVFLAFVPWAVLAGMAFNARATSWSGVRFSFDRDARPGETSVFLQAFLVYVIYPAVEFLTLFLAHPFLEKERRRFHAERHRFGGERFLMQAGTAEFAKIFAVALAFWIALAALPAWWLVRAVDFEELAPERAYVEELPAEIVVAALVLVAAFLAARTLWRALRWNVVLNDLALAEPERSSAGYGSAVRFRSSLDPLGILAIVLTNGVLVLLSLGLLIPWAQVRYHRALAESVSADSDRSPDSFVERAEELGSAAGQEIMQAEGLDPGIGV